MMGKERQILADNELVAQPKSISGLFDVCSSVKLKGEVHIPSNKTDNPYSSGSMPISVSENAFL